MLELWRRRNLETILIAATPGFPTTTRSVSAEASQNALVKLRTVRERIEYIISITFATAGFTRQRFHSRWRQVPQHRSSKDQVGSTAQPQMHQALWHRRQQRRAPRRSLMRPETEAGSSTNDHHW